MMRALDLIHRWTGGLIGLVLAVLGLSGALLVYREAFLRATLPHAADALQGDPAAMITRLFDGDQAPRSIVLAGDELGVHRLTYAEGAGAYVDQAGNIVTHWSSTWERPELWLFDLHHHLLGGEVGDTIAGIAALIGIGFVVTGIILWWQTRKTFAFRPWPRRMSRPAIVRHHRDLGVVLAPLLFLSMLTGAMIIFRPVANLLLSPFSTSAEMEAARRPPKARGGAFALDGKDWTAMIATARARFPDAQLRSIGLPRKPGDLVTIRMRQPAEWLPNGRTTLWFDPADGRLVEARDAMTAPKGSRIFSLVYPVHAAKVGGLFWTLAMTASGLALAMLGSFTVFTFWSARASKRKAPRRVVAKQAG